MLAFFVLGIGATAQAAITHPYTGKSFGPGGVESGSFENAVGVAVQQASGDTFVLEAGGSGRVYKFDAAGNPIDFSGTGTNVIEGVGSAGGSEEEIAVDNSTGPDAGDIYVANNGGVRIYSSGGALLGQLSGGEMCGVAVDPSGDVYVGIYPETVRKYKPVTNPVTNADESASMSGLSGVCNVAVDSAGDVYAARYSGEVTKYSALQFGSLSASGTSVDPQGRTLAVDPLSGEVFVDDVDRIAQYDGSSEPPKFEGRTGATGAGALTDSFGVGVDHASGELYAADGGSVEIFGPGQVIAGATTEAATGTSSSGATLHGTVEPAGTEVTGCVFEYGTEAGALNQSAPCAPNTPYTGSAPVAVSAHLSGLQLGTTYDYRIAASTTNGPVVGEERSFVTTGPQILGESAPESELGANHATVQAEVNPGGEATTYRVEYGITSEYGSRTAPVELEAGEAPVLAAVQLTALQPSTTYHFRFVAVNAAGTATGRDQSFTTEPPERLSAVSVTKVGASSATLSAWIFDFGLPATYRYEYGTTTAYGLATSSAALAAAEGELRAPATLTGLSPSTTYHLRLVVETAAGTTRSPDVSLTTEAITAPSILLPDGRGYEKVSPAANADGDVYQDVPLALGSEGGYTEQPFLVSPDGSAVAYMADPSEGGGIGREGAGYGNQYLATRDAAGGWNAVNIEPASSNFFDVPTFKGFSADLSVGFVNSKSTTPIASGAPSGGYSVLYAKTLPTGSYDPLITSTPPHRTPAEFGAPGTPGVSGEEVAYAGSSADLGHELFMANDTLTPNALDGGEEENNLYDASGDKTTLVNVLPDGSTEPNATFGGPHLPLDGSENAPILGHDISADGGRIFWTDLNTHDLYVRENDTAPQSPVTEGKCTVSADACTVLIAEAAQFWNATPDGSKVLYSKGGDLYERDIDSGQSVDLAPGGEVNGVTAASEDLSYVYFVAKAALAPGAQTEDCHEEDLESGCNLYAVHVGEPIRFIGELSGEDNVSRPESFGQFDGDWQGSLANAEAEATPDGAHLLFTSRASLTGYENNHAGEIFLYDFDEGQLHCLSCKPTGEAVTQYNSAFLPVSHVGTSLPQWISDDGARVFFDTLDALVPQDTNERTDVYEWERDGAGSCTEETGCIYLLSDGTAPEGSFLIGASTSGDDVFITTRSKLLPEDENENVDVYDVRVGATRAPTPQQCSGTGCQGVPAAPPVFATPPSVTYGGVGNLDPAAPAPASKAAPKPLTRAQKLAKALRACKGEAKKKRAACERQARSRYGTKTKKHPSSKKRGNVKQSSRRSK
jgi:hypothetical protein